MRTIAVLLLLLVIIPTRLGLAKDAVFSGPHSGERLTPFKVRLALSNQAGQEADFVTQAGGKPIVLIFIHIVNRPALRMANVLANYTASRSKDGLHTGVVWLADDVTEAENTLKRSGHALAKNAPTGISMDGAEGPGSYGLNRNVELTILVGKEGKVTANFALVQPSIQADLPKILDAIVKVAGGTAPKIEELEGMREQMIGGAVDVRSFLQPLIRRDATVEAVEKAAKNVEAQLAKDSNFRKEIGRISNTIVDSGKLQNYGTTKAQEYLRKWAKEIGKP